MRGLGFKECGCGEVWVLGVVLGGDRTFCRKGDRTFLTRNRDGIRAIALFVVRAIALINIAMTELLGDFPRASSYLGDWVVQRYSKQGIFHNIWRRVDDYTKDICIHTKNCICFCVLNNGVWSAILIDISRSEGENVYGYASIDANTIALASVEVK